MSKKAKRSISTFAILLAVMLLVSIATWIAAGNTYTDADGNTAEVVGATSSDIFMAPVNGSRRYHLRVLPRRVPCDRDRHRRS